MLERDVRAWYSSVMLFERDVTVYILIVLTLNLSPTLKRTLKCYEKLNSRFEHRYDLKKQFEH